ncbi:MAG: hypothetical protein E7619_06865 [Ruminococcaceae bacterium]|nr:hypothetical protein [Oscillospiraceae bacterium]
MQKVLKREDAALAREALGDEVFNYICSEECETFESHKGLNIIAFDWYDTDAPDTPQAKMTICVNRDHLIVFCEDDRAYRTACQCLVSANGTERALYGFFSRLIRTDMSYLDGVECRINATEERLMKYLDSDCLMEILDYRYELFDLKRYYQQLVSVFESCEENENGLLSEEGTRYFSVLANRAGRLLDRTASLRDYVSQAREAYQSQIDIEQNKLMRVFTVITAVFLPLNLLVGWYGMNFKYMPELSLPYAYGVFAAVCAVIVTVLIIIFKKRRWF